jgi:cell wall-associated NlpC family hydrolase
MTPRPGDFGLTRINGYAGGLIRVGQWLNGNGFSEFEHAFIVLPDGKIIEAEPGGARIADLSEYDTVPTTFSHWNLTDVQRSDIGNRARQLEGIPYSALDYLALAAHRLHIPTPGLRGYIATSGHLICSQLVDECYARAGVHLFTDDRWPGYVTPGALRQVLTGPLGG